MRKQRSTCGLLVALFLTAGAAETLANNLDNLFIMRNARTRRASSSDPNLYGGNGDARPIPPGQTLTIADLKGPGIIRHIWFTISAEDPEYGRSITLRMYWDGEEEPAVECPLGDFFAVGHGALKMLNSMPVAVTSDGRGLNCYWSMPFAKSAKLTLTNDSKKHKVHSAYWYVDYEEVDQLPRNAAYFHAQYRQEYPATMGKDYLILDAEGRGHYVGTVLSVVLRTQSWFGEGDDFFYIDGAEEPQLRGTGTEDYFCDGWGFRLLDRPFTGIPVMDGYEVGDRISVYRWHINDPVHFQNSLKVTIEHKGVMFNAKGENISGFMERPDLFSSVAFWYQTGKAKRYATIPPAEERVVPHRLFEMEAFAKDAKAERAFAPLEVQDGGYSGGKQLLAKYNEKGGVVTIPIKVEKATQGLGRLKLTRSWDYGVWRVSLDGKLVPGGENVDLYSADIRSTDIKLGHVKLDPGTHELKLECVGQNPASKGFFLGVDSLDLMEITPYTAERQ